MTPEEKTLLKETAELARENNKILKSIRRSARFSAFLRFIYWSVILGGAVGTYYFIQPYLNAIMNGYSEIQKNITSIKGVSDKIPSISDLLSGKQ